MSFSQKELFEILNNYIISGEKKEIIEKLALRPERFTGIFRPTKPHGKIMQHILQSREIKMGNALEKVTQRLIEDMGYEIINNNLIELSGEKMKVDIYFRDAQNTFFIELKIRDDHDSSKKRGQIKNFEKKLEALYDRHGNSLIAIMYFVDPSFRKNSEFYKLELDKINKYYPIEILLMYGPDLFVRLGEQRHWNKMLEWIKNWKDRLPTTPSIKFDSSTQELNEIPLTIWRRFIEVESIWEEGFVEALFDDARLLFDLLEIWKSTKKPNYQELAHELDSKLSKYFRSKSH